MSGCKFSPKLIAVVIMTLFFVVALYLRIAFPYEQVFGSGWIKFTGVDAYYHMRLVDNLVHNLPHYISFDPYTFYPHGSPVDWPPFFDWLLAGIIWLTSLGSPTQHIVDLVGVYMPPVLGALTIIPVYFIGKELFGRWAGVLSAGLIALMPGEFLGRSMLGFTDHHVAETLLTTTAMMFLILAVKSARQKGLLFTHLKPRDWATIRKPFIYSLLAGIFLGLYLITWIGGLLFIFLIFTYFVIQFIIDHLKRRNTDYLTIVATSFFFIAFIVSLPVLYQLGTREEYLTSLPIAILTPAVLSGISRLLTRKKIAPVYYPLILVGVGVAGLGVIYATNPDVLKSILRFLRFFDPTTVSTILEEQPLLLPLGKFTTRLAWSNFTTGFFLSIGLLLYWICYKRIIRKQDNAEENILLVWSLIILAATLGQRRFAYYFAVNAALLTGYLSWLILEFAGFKRAEITPLEISTKVNKEKAKRKKPKEGGLHLTTSQMRLTLGLVVVFFLSFFPNIGPAVNLVSLGGYVPSNAWGESLSWLKDNTPDPFGNPDFYYELYEPPPPGENYNYPKTAYGVMAWWDYGHWITRIAHRLPSETPAKWGACTPFFSAQDEASASRIIDKLGIKYVIVDYDTATAKFLAAVTLADKKMEDFYEIYYLPQKGKLVPVLLFYPGYYRSLAVRLYNFDGNEVTDATPLVITYEEKMSRDGRYFKEVINLRDFPTYEEAEAYISSKKSGNHRIVNSNPFVSPVPLEKLEHYKLIYSSNSSIMQRDIGMIPIIKIFEYVK